MLYLYEKALFFYLIRHHACRLSMDGHFPLKEEPWDNECTGDAPGFVV